MKKNTATVSKSRFIRSWKARKVLEFEKDTQKSRRSQKSWKRSH